MATKSLSIRIEEEMLDKLHVIADYEGRSANSQILVLIRDLIESYEKKHGEIKTGKRYFDRKRIGFLLKSDPFSLLTRKRCRATRELRSRWTAS